jgi:hypothetical protein
MAFSANAQSADVLQSGSGAGASGHTFPAPTLTLVEFSDVLGLLLASRTERDDANRRLVLKGVGYVRIEPRAWGAAAYPEVWLQQTPAGFFVATDPRTNRVFRHPSRRRYEVSFLSKEVFDCAIQCIKEKRVAPIYELAVVSLGARPGFSVESGCLLAPDDYASEHSLPGGVQWIDQPPRVL